MGYPGWQLRDRLAPTFRNRLLTAARIVPFRHQAEIFAFLDRKTIAKEPLCNVNDVRHYSEFPSLRATLDHGHQWLIATPQYETIDIQKYGETVAEQVPTYYDDNDEITLVNTGKPVISYDYYNVTDSDRPRPQVVSVSAAFKAGKSVLGGVIPASFAITPDLAWDIWAYEYDVAEPEFTYITDLLLSEKGLALPHIRYKTGNELKGYITHKLDVKQGRMELLLSNGARFVCRSLKLTLESTTSDPLKGKERDGFSVGEVYQMPSIQALLSYRQNLAARNGYYVMPSTPDRPIMDQINDRADPDNDEYPTWLGVKEIHRRENPYAFKLDDYLEDLKTFSREEMTVYWEGKSGFWIGSVYPAIAYFDTTTHPEFWKDPDKPPTLENFAPPAWMKRVSGADTATMYSVVSALVSDTEIFYIDCRTNYRYVTGQIEKLQEVTVESLCDEVRNFRNVIGGKWGRATCDHNSQWLDEFRRHGVPLHRSPRRDPQQRTEATRGMAQNGFLWFAPWLRDTVLPYEFSIAKYPPKEKFVGKQRRLDENDHALDSAEHIAALHPRASLPPAEKKLDPIRALAAAARRRANHVSGDPMLGG